MQYGEVMLQWAKALFPICRSITGDGQRQTLDYIASICQGMERLSFKTGDKVFDWTIPKEWAIRDAFIEHESGKRFAQFSDSNLHVLNYSAPVSRTLTKAELLPHIYTQPDQPDWVPYVTSYYKERWGFCMAEKVKQSLPEGQYKAYVDSSLTDGHLEIGELLIPGESSQEIFFSTYTCHPSLANNELSGPVVAMALIDYLQKQYSNNKFTYRVVFVPETIGSIAYLSRKLSELQQNVMAGYILSCVGDERAYSHVQSRMGDSLADRALQAALIGRDNVKTYHYLRRGSDERQYCSPGVDLPVCGFCRSKYGEYPEYHTSADNFDVVTAAGLQGAFSVIASIIDAFETGLLYPKAALLCEPQLGDRGLYPSVGQKGDHKKKFKLRMNVLSYADGQHSLFDMANLVQAPLVNVIEEVLILKRYDLLR